MLNIALVSDYNYLSYTNSCTKSLLQHNKNINIFLCYIGKKTELKNLNYKHINITLKNKKFNDNKKTKKPKHTMDNEYVQYFPNSSEYVTKKNCYCNNIRFFFIKSLLNKGINNIVYIDVDNLCNKNLNFLLPYSYNFDILLEPFTSNKSKKLNYKTNFMFIKNTQNTRKFFNTLVKKIKNKIYTWGHTNLFTDIITKTDIKIKNLPNNFVDTSYNENSYIWSGESFRKNKNLVKLSTNNNKFLDKINNTSV